MKTTFTLKRTLAAALLVLAGVTQSSAMEFQMTWVKAEAYPTGAGTVYVDWTKDGEKTFAATSEFKRTSNADISSGFVWAQPAAGYLLAGFARDNGNLTYDNGADQQIKVLGTGYFDAIPDPQTFTGGSSSSEGQEMAEEALNALTQPTDLIFAVFTQGAVARNAVGQENCGWTRTSKLDNAPGDQVSFSAFGDSYYVESDGKNVYSKFDHWTNASGETVGTERTLTVTVQGMETFYAVYVETTKEDFDATERHASDTEDIRNVNFDGNANGNAIYDLQGRRVLEPTHGVFIRNGRKFVVR